MEREKRDTGPFAWALALGLQARDAYCRTAGAVRFGGSTACGIAARQYGFAICVMRLDPQLQPCYSSTDYTIHVTAVYSTMYMCN